MTVGRALAHHRMAVVRDLLALGYRAPDQFRGDLLNGHITPRLSLYELTCIIVAAPPSTSVKFFLDGGWSREARILANMQEQDAGLSHMQEPYERPDQVVFPVRPTVDNPFGDAIFKADEMSVEEMDRRLEERYAAASHAQDGHGGSRRF